MAEEEEKKKFNFKKIALFGVGPIAFGGYRCRSWRLSFYANANAR